MTSAEALKSLLRFHYLQGVLVIIVVLCKMQRNKHFNLFTDLPMNLQHGYNTRNGYMYMPKMEWGRNYFKSLQNFCLWDFDCANMEQFVCFCLKNALTYYFMWRMWMFANYLDLHHCILSDACHTLSLIEILDDYLQFYLSVLFCTSYIHYMLMFFLCLEMR